MLTIDYQSEPYAAGKGRAARDLPRLVAFARRPNYDAVAVTPGMPKGGSGPTRGRCLAKLRRLPAEDRGWSVS